MDVQDLALFVDLAKRLLVEEKDQPVAIPIQAGELSNAIDITLSEEGLSQQAFKAVLQDLIKHTPKTSSKRFFNQLFGGRRPESIVADLLGVLLNNSMYTYKVAGPMVGVEKEVIRQVCNIIDYPTTSDGAFASGGSMTNLMAMLIARDRKAPHVRYDGLSSRMTAYSSEVSHYSIEKNMAFIGIGRSQLRLIKTDEKGRMLAADLNNKIEEDRTKGFIPFFVNTTAGTTVLGAFDPIKSITEVCKKHNVFLHVDGAYCGGVIFSEKYKHLVDGLRETDSFSFNAHKMLNTTLTCSILVTREKIDLYNSFAIEADYLYQTDADEFNLGKTSLQCGRRNDAFKFWALWKAVGRNGLARMVENEFHLADVARSYVSEHPDYTLHNQDQSLSVCFNYKNIDPEILCKNLYEKGSLMVGHGSFRNQKFVRLVTINSSNKAEDIIAFFKELERFVKEEM